MFAVRRGLAGSLGDSLGCTGAGFGVFVRSSRLCGGGIRLLSQTSSSSVKNVDEAISVFEAALQQCDEEIQAERPVLHGVFNDWKESQAFVYRLNEVLKSDDNLTKVTSSKVLSNLYLKLVLITGQFCVGGEFVLGLPHKNDINSCLIEELILKLTENNELEMASNIVSSLDLKTSKIYPRTLLPLLSKNAENGDKQTTLLQQIQFGNDLFLGNELSAKLAETLIPQSPSPLFVKEIQNIYTKSLSKNSLTPFNKRRILISLIESNAKVYKFTKTWDLMKENADIMQEVTSFRIVELPSLVRNFSVGSFENDTTMRLINDEEEARLRPLLLSIIAARAFELGDSGTVITSISQNESLMELVNEDTIFYLTAGASIKRDASVINSLLEILAATGYKIQTRKTMDCMVEMLARVGYYKEIVEILTKYNGIDDYEVSTKVLELLKEKGLV